MSTLIFNNDLFDLLNLNNQNYFYQNRCNPTSSSATPSCYRYKQQPQVQVYSPSIDISETSDSFIIDLELTGVNKDDISIQFDDNKLIVQANKLKPKRLYNNNNNNNKSTGKGEDEESKVKQPSSTTTVPVASEQPSIEEINDDEFFNNNNPQPSSPKPTTNTAATSTTSASSTNKKIEIKEEEAKEIIGERKFGKLKRIIDLSSHRNVIDIQSIKASHNNGLLEITIPKKDAPKPIKITVQ
eukprot:gene2867-3562_t